MECLDLTVSNFMEKSIGLKRVEFTICYCKKLNICRSQFGNQKRLTYWCSFNFGGFSIKCPLKLFSILVGATIKGKNMLPLGSIFFPLLVAPFKMWFTGPGNRCFLSKVGLSI